MAQPLSSRLHDADLELCRLANRVDRRIWLLVARVASKLGDGYVWIVLAYGLLLGGGLEARAAVTDMLLLTLISLPLYKGIKCWARRDRPYVTHPDIALLGTPLDHGSFPSGHTTHAVGFTVVLAFHFPTLAWLLLPLTLAIAMSRIVLGLHYPTDVLCGATLGATPAILLGVL